MPFKNLCYPGNSAGVKMIAKRAYVAHEVGIGLAAGSEDMAEYTFEVRRRSGSGLDHCEVRPSSAAVEWAPALLYRRQGDAL